MSENCRIENGSSGYWRPLMLVQMLMLLIIPVDWIGKESGKLSLHCHERIGSCCSGGGSYPHFLLLLLLLMKFISNSAAISQT